jgi:hypothetical protein
MKQKLRANHHIYKALGERKSFKGFHGIAPSLQFMRLNLVAWIKITLRRICSPNAEEETKEASLERPLL